MSEGGSERERELTRFAEQSLELRLSVAADQLAEEFNGVYERDAIKAVLDESAKALSVNGITPYVHILAERFTRERLTALAQSQGRMAKAVPQIVFISLTGAGRAQIAAAMLARRAGDTVAVHCAGSHAATEIDANVRAALDEIGIDLGDAFTKPLTSEVMAGADVVVTMGRSVGEVAIPESARHVDWRVGDPADAELPEVRRVVEDIGRRVDVFAEELTGTTAGASAAPVP